MVITWTIHRILARNFTFMLFAFRQALEHCNPDWASAGATVAARKTAARARKTILASMSALKSVKLRMECVP